MTKFLRRSGFLSFASALLVFPAALAQTTYRETILHDFAAELTAKGAVPQSIIRDQAGNIYGTTQHGGAWGAGVVFKLDSAGQETVLYNFTGGADGGNPYAGVIRDQAGNLYGTTLSGGNYCDVEPNPTCGLVYKIDPSGHQTVLYAFNGADGSVPYAGVIRDQAGNLYGATVFGGAANQGEVFKLDVSGHLTVLHSFRGGTDGALPTGDVLLVSGNLYGTTSCGGTGTGCSGGGAGTVFKLDAAGHETILYSFSGGADGSSPQAAVILDAAGNLYGTTEQGGTSGAGVVFMLDPSDHETVLYSFLGGSRGGYPWAPLILDEAGNLYGTAAGSPETAGVVFKVNPAGQETVLHAFVGSGDGRTPLAGVVRDAAGNLFGTASRGGPAGQGMVFKVDTNGQETVLYDFPGKRDGAKPRAGLAVDGAGNLYGTTSAGGDGTVFKVDASGKYSLVYMFASAQDGKSPYAAVTLDPAGNIYGTTYTGGANFSDGGTVFKLDASGKETVLHSFGLSTSDGASPAAGVTLDAAGNLYGTTLQGGNAGCFIYSGCGIVYKLDASGNESILYAFTGGADGGNPLGGVTLDAAGNVYGTTSDGGSASGTSGNGVVFKIAATGQMSVLYTFTGGADGGTPEAGMIFGPDGNLYGTTYIGGTTGHGVVFKLSLAGQLTVLYSFTGGADGGNPLAGVIFDSAGNLYGTTAAGGTPASGYGRGVVFALDPAGHETVLHTFTAPPDGTTPNGGVVLDSAGNLYGTTYQGGKQTEGTVFKLSPQ